MFKFNYIVCPYLCTRQENWPKKYVWRAICWISSRLCDGTDLSCLIHDNQYRISLQSDRLLLAAQPPAESLSLLMSDPPVKVRVGQRGSANSPNKVADQAERENNNQISILLESPRNRTVVPHSQFTLPFLLTVYGINVNNLWWDMCEMNSYVLKPSILLGITFERFARLLTYKIANSDGR